MYTRKTGTIAFRIGDNESSGRGTVQYRSLNPTGAWDRHWPTILKSWSTPDTGTCTQLNSWLQTTQRQQCWSDHVFLCVSNKNNLTELDHSLRTKAYSLLQRLKRKPPHKTRTSQQVVNVKTNTTRPEIWKRNKLQARTANSDCESATEERKLNANGAAAGAGTRRSILRHLAQYCGTTSAL